MAKAKIAISMDADLVKRLDRLAPQMHRNRSELIEIFVRQQMDETEAGASVLTNPVVGPIILEALSKPEILRAMAGVMSEKMTDQQMQLFGQAMQAAADVVSPGKQAPSPGVDPNTEFRLPASSEVRRQVKRRPGKPASDRASKRSAARGMTGRGEKA